MTSIQQTLAIIKPDALCLYETQILQKISANGFKILANARIIMSEYQAMDFYQEHSAKRFYDSLVKFMSSGPILVVVLSRIDAIQVWRKLLGPTDSVKARETDPESIRAIYGTDNQQNACHGSDSVVSAVREINFFFPNVQCEPLPSMIKIEDFLDARVFPILNKGLAALCTAKPAKPVEWLGEWLHLNNPKRPQVIFPDEVDPKEISA